MFDPSEATDSCRKSSSDETPGNDADTPRTASSVNLNKRLKDNTHEHIYEKMHLESYFLFLFLILLDVATSFGEPQNVADVLKNLELKIFLPSSPQLLKSFLTTFEKQTFFNQSCVKRRTSVCSLNFTKKVQYYFFVNSK